MTRSTTIFPSFSFLAIVLSSPFHQGTIWEGAVRLSFLQSAVSLMRLPSQGTRKPRRLHPALGFDGDAIAVKINGTVWFGHSTHLPKSQSYY